MTGLNLYHRLIRYGVLESTNGFAAESLQSSNPANGTVILADYQTKGKGQAENVWIGEKGRNLAFTIIYYPNGLDAGRQFNLSMALSAGIYDFLHAELAGIKIKWPNDIYATNKKIAGILIENGVQGNRLVSSLLGVGLNVNQELFPDFEVEPTSMKLEKKLEYDREQVLRGVLGSIGKWLDILHLGNTTLIKEKYEKCLYLYKRWAEFSTGGSTFTAMINGVNEYGQLVLVKKDSSTAFFNFKEIRFLQ